MPPADRRALAVELAVEIAGFMRGFGTPAHHGFMSAFADCCSILWKLGVAFPTDADGSDAQERPMPDDAGQLPAYFSILPEEQIRSRVAALREVADEDFDRLLDAFVGKADHLPERFPVHRRWFAPLPFDRPLMEAFRRCGFADCADGRYRWTDAMLPYMARRGFWTGSGREFGELQAEELKAFLSQLPGAIRHELIDLARIQDSDLFFLRRIMDGLDQEEWLRHFPNYGNSAVSISRDLLALLRGSGSGS